MPVEMKKEIRKRVACMIGTTEEALRKAEAECDGRVYMGPVDAKGTLGGFYLLHIPVKGKIEPTLYPLDYFVKQNDKRTSRGMETLSGP